MFTANKFALQNISKQGFTSLMFFLCVAITAASVFGTGFFTQNMELGIKRSESRVGAEIIIAPEEYKEAAEGVLFQGKACTLFTDDNVSDEIQDIKGINAISPQLFFKTLTLSCCSAAGVQLIAIEPETDFAVSARTESNSVSEIGVDEMIAGSACGLKVNNKVSFYGRTFTVTDVLDECGTGYDESVFISRESADLITADPEYKTTFGEKTGLFSIILVDLEEGYDSSFIRDKINSRVESRGFAALTTGSFAEQLIDRIKSFELFGCIMNVFVIGLASIALFALVTITFNLRRNRVGSLLSVGIAKSTIIKSFLLEYFYLTIGGVLSGICLVCIVVFPLHQVIKNALNLPYQFIGMGNLLLIGLITLSISVVMLLAAVSFSFVKILKTEPAILAEEQT